VAGLSTCGQFEIATSTSMSARSTTRSPGCDEAGANVRSSSVFSGCTGTWQKKFTFGTRSRRPRPSGSIAASRFSRQPGRSGTPYSASLDGAEQQPPIVSWRPHVSSTSVSSGRATSDSSWCPVVRYSVAAFLMVFGAL